MARTRSKHRRKAGFTLPVAVVAGFLPGISTSLDYFNRYGFQGLSTQLGRVYLGYDSQTSRWIPSLMWQGTGPLAIGLIVHKVASMLGVNRALASARIPFIRI